MRHLSSPIFPIPLTVLALAGLLCAGCEQASDSVVDAAGEVPVLLSASVAPQTIDTDTIKVGPTRKPDDLLPLHLSASAGLPFPATPGASNHAMYAVTVNENGQPIASGELTAQGGSGGGANDTLRFGGNVEITIPRSTVGTLWVSIWGELAGGIRSTESRLPVTVVRLNRPPVLSNLHAPDTVVTSQMTAFLITVQAADTNGLSDIKSVFRITPSEKIYFLNDSGVNGDAVAADGIYTETVSLVPPPPRGSYLFRFQAVDRLGDSSNVLTHIIVVDP